jgi:hypothetical protein
MLVLLAAVLICVPDRPADAAPVTPPADAWPQWRGPLGTGVGPNAQPPVEWGETKNIRWKTPLPGKGHSTPVVWGDRIFLTTAIPEGEPVKPRFVRPGAHDNLDVTQRHAFAVLAVSRATGKILWQKTVHTAVPHEAGHVTGSLASASPATDGERVYASFGSHGLYCLDVDGKLIWKKDLSEMHSKHGHGEGSSPAVFGDTLVVNWDHEAQSFLVALDKRTGQQRWRVAPAEDTAWATPLVVEHAGHRRRDLGVRRAVVERRGVAGRGKRRRLRRQQLRHAGHARRETRRGQGRRHRDEASAVDAESRHAVRAVAAVVQRHDLQPATLPGRARAH